MVTVTTVYSDLDKLDYVPEDAKPSVALSKAMRANRMFTDNVRVALGYYDELKASDAWMQWKGGNNSWDKVLDIMGVTEEAVEEYRIGYALLSGQGVTTPITGQQAREAAKSKSEEIAERQAKARELREDGMTQQQIAEVLGVTDRTIRSDLKAEEKPARAEKISAPRQQIRYAIYAGTKPETAARRIREVFGDEFADALVGAMMDQGCPPHVGASAPS